MYYVVKLLLMVMEAGEDSPVCICNIIHVEMMPIILHALDNVQHFHMYYIPHVYVRIIMVCRHAFKSMSFHFYIFCIAHLHSTVCSGRNRNLIGSDQT